MSEAKIYRENIFPSLRQVRLYYPNNWRRYAGDLAPEKDKKFNWFLCSRRYKDPLSGMFVAEIAKGIKFYDEESGNTLSIPADVDARLLIIDDLENKPPEEIMKIIREYTYQGAVALHKCDIKNQDEFFVCREATFWFDGILKEIKKESSMIIDYSKKNNECLRAKIPTFPTSPEIDVMLREYPRALVCKALYQDLVGYMNS